MIEKIINILRDKNIAILGFGREGKTSYQFIKKYLPESKITIIDSVDYSSDDLVKEDTNVSFVFGENYLDNLNDYDLILKTPGISLLGVEYDSSKITSQIELLLETHRDKVIGITGTKGKSTTTTLAYTILKENGYKAVLVGNIGTPAFSMLDEVDDDTYFVIEMSSHQLETLRLSPHIGVILNLFQDHLDHTGSIEAYHEAKMNMFRFQEENDYAIYYKDNETLNNRVNNSDIKSTKITVSTSDIGDIYLKDNDVYYNGEVVFNRDLKRNILGDHNFINIMVCFVIGKLFNINDSDILKSISNLKPLQYRMENLGEFEGVYYYVDTLATIPEATLATISAIDNIDTLIFGGLDRGISYEGFADKLKLTGINNFICMPKTGYDIGKELPDDKTYYAEDLKTAVEIAKKVTAKGKVCILSPAAASYEYFKNYAEKGDKYKEYIFN